MVTVAGFVGVPAILVGLVIAWPGIDLSTARAWFGDHSYLQAYFEAMVAGLIPLLFVLIRKEDVSVYGIRRDNLIPSIVLSLVVVAGHWVELFFRLGEWFPHGSLGIDLSFPANVWYALVGIISNGPLEAFFLIWLLVKIDQITGNEEKTISWGLIIAAVFFGLFHIISTGSLPNALRVTIIYLTLSLIFKGTRNGIGPLLGWTLINGMTLAYAELLLR